MWKKINITQKQCNTIKFDIAIQAEGGGIYCMKLFCEIKLVAYIT